MDVPVILTLRIADKCSVGSREELVLNLCALFSDALSLIMRSRGFLYRHERQIGLRGNAVVGNRLKIVPEQA